MRISSERVKVYAVREVMQCIFNKPYVIPGVIPAESYESVIKDDVVRDSDSDIER